MEEEKNVENQEQCETTKNAEAQEPREVEKNTEAQEQCKVTKKAFSALSAMSAQTAVTKQEILNELEMTYNVERKKCNRYINSAMSAGLIKKHKGKYYYDETDEQTKLENVGAANYNRKSSKTAIWIVIIIILAAIVITALNSVTKSYTIPNTNINIEISNNQKLYLTYDEISEIIGTEDASDYAFIMKEKNDEYYVYGMLLDKADYEEIGLATLMEYDRALIASYFGEDSVSEVTDINLGNVDFKHYSYNYDATDASGNPTEELAVMYLAEIDEYYVFISLYANSNYTIEDTDQIIDQLLK